MVFGYRECIAVLMMGAAAAQPPLPDLKTEPTPGGSVFTVRNAAAQPLTAYLIELVNYPGSSYSLWQDEVGREPLSPGDEKKIPVTNMTVGAVPDYVKLQAAVYADGTTSGLPEKVKQLLDRRRAVLETTRELIQRLESGQTATLKDWTDSMPPIERSKRNSQAAINQGAAKALIADYAAKLEKQSTNEVLTALRAFERALAASKPAL